MMKISMYKNKVTGSCCRLSASLTTDDHMLKPQHLSPLLFLHLELQPPWGLGMGATASWLLRPHTSDKPISDEFINKSKHKGYVSDVREDSD